MSRHFCVLSLLAALAPTVASAYVEPPPELRSQVFRLVREGHDATNPMARKSPHADARSALLNCENAERVGHGVAEACGNAQQKVTHCVEFIDTWRRERTETLRQVDALAAKVGETVGQEYSDASNLRGLGKQRDSEMLWNDNVKILRNREIPGCPAELPGSARTPEQVLAESRDGKGRKRSGGAPTSNDPSSLFQQSASDIQREAADPSAREARLRWQAQKDADARQVQNQIQARGAQQMAMARNILATLPTAGTVPAVPPTGGAGLMGTQGAPVSTDCMSNCTGPYCPCICAGIDDSACEKGGSGSAPTAQLPQPTPPATPATQTVSYKTPDGKRNCVTLARDPVWEGDYYKFYFKLDDECGGMWNVVVTLGQRQSATLSPTARIGTVTFYKTTVLSAGDSWRADIKKL